MPQTAFFVWFAYVVGQPSLSLILFHIERTSSSDLPILVEITFQENRDFSSAFRVRSFCLSSEVQSDSGLKERDRDWSRRRRRLAGAFGADLAFCLRFGGDGVLVESFEGAGKTSGGGAATCWCGSVAQGRWVSTSSSISVSSSAISGDGMGALSMKALVWSE